MKPLPKVSAEKYPSRVEEKRDVVTIPQPKGASTGAICKTCGVKRQSHDPAGSTHVLPGLI
jgi:hypothetical protein